MLTAKRPIGFGGIDQVAQFFDVSKVEVRRKAVSGEWPSYVIGGRRVFDIDAILDLLMQQSDHSISTDDQTRRASIKPGQRQGRF